MLQALLHTEYSFEYVQYSIDWREKNSNKNTIKSISIVLKDIK